MQRMDDFETMLVSGGSLTGAWDIPWIQQEQQAAITAQIAMEQSQQMADAISTNSGAGLAGFGAQIVVGIYMAVTGQGDPAATAGNPMGDYTGSGP